MSTEIHTLSDIWGDHLSRLHIVLFLSIREVIQPNSHSYVIIARSFFFAGGHSGLWSSDRLWSGGCEFKGLAEVLRLFFKCFWVRLHNWTWLICQRWLLMGARVRK